MGLQEEIAELRKTLELLEGKVQEQTIAEQKATEKPRMVKYIHVPKTGLDWLSGPMEDTTFAQAKAFCEENKDAAGGGWRLPTLAELETLILPDGKTGLDEAFGFEGNAVWSSEEKMGGVEVYGFETQRVANYRLNGSSRTRVLLVRSRKTE